jgi:predicted RNA methylase
MSRTKTIDQNVLEVLSGLEVSGYEVRIVTQLDRKMYLRVDEVLQAIGGKWNRKAGAHVFEVDPREALDNAITTGEVVRAKDLGFFPTPPQLAMELVGMADVAPGMRVLEPSAGEGAIVAALRVAGADVWASEIDPGRFQKLAAEHGATDSVLVTLQNFMHVPPAPSFDRVVMNPPFCKVNDCDHIHHVQRAFSWLKPKGILVSVLPASVSFRQDRRYREFRDWYKGHKGVLKDLPDDSFKASGTGVRTVVLKMQAPKA